MASQVNICLKKQNMLSKLSARIENIRVRYNVILKTACCAYVWKKHLKKTKNSVSWLFLFLLRQFGDWNVWSILNFLGRLGQYIFIILSIINIKYFLKEKKMFRKCKIKFLKHYMLTCLPVNIIFYSRIFIPFSFPLF